MRGKDLTARVVYDLLLEVEDLKSSCITFDNWYTSAGLVSALAKIGVACRGTCRSDRTGNAPLESVALTKKSARGSFSRAASDSY